MTEICGQKFLWAQQLVANEQETREEALSQMTDWLKTQKTLTDDDAEKIWYVLWNALWMTDRVLTQHAFCDKICQILDVLQKDCTHPFIEQFFVVMQGYWERLDKWRTEKFLVLGRKFLDKIVEYCKENNEIEYIPQLIEKAFSLEKGNAFKLHIVDVMVDYLHEFITKDTKVGYLYLNPFVNIYTKSHNQSSLVNRINDRIITPLIDSLGEIFFGEDEDAALKYLRSLQASLNYSIKHPDSNVKIQNLRMDKRQELREVLVAVNKKRAAEGKPLLKIDKVD